MRFHELWEDEEDFSSIPADKVDFSVLKCPEGFNVVGNHLEDEQGNYVLALGKKHLTLSEDEMKMLLYSSSDE